MSMDKIMEDRKEVVEKIAADIEAGKPLFWESGLTVSGRPRNIMQRSGRSSYYRGGNNLRLSFVAMQHGYTDPRWGTFKQVQEMGGRSRSSSPMWYSMQSKWRGFPLCRKHRENQRC